MDLRNILTILWRRKGVIVVTFLVTVVVVVIGTLLSPKTYEATAKIRVASISGTTGAYSDYIYSDKLINTYVIIATSRPVMDELMNRTNLSQDPVIKVEAIPDTELIAITAEHSSPSTASVIANELADILVQQSKNVYTGEGKSVTQILQDQLTQLNGELAQMNDAYQLLVTQSPTNTAMLAEASQAIDLKQRTYATLLDQYEQARVRDEIRANVVSIVEPAVPPITPSKPKFWLNISLAAVVGLVAGTGLGFMLENLDNTLYSTQQVEALSGSHPLGAIPFAKGQNQQPVFQEAIRRLRTNILMLNDGKPPRTILITSPRPEEGKSTLVSQVAVAMTQVGKKVVVVDADMRKPHQHEKFNLPNQLGLSNLLLGEAKLEDILQSTEVPGLQVIPSGPIPTDPVEILSSNQIPSLVKELEQKNDLILFDSPSFLEVTDAAVLAQNVDWVILVVQIGKTQSNDVTKLMEQLNCIHVAEVGVVMNRLQADGRAYYYKY